MEQGEELVKEALLAFFGELPVEAVHAAPEHGAEIVHIALRGHPVCSGGFALVAYWLVHILTYILAWCLVRGCWLDAPESHAVVVWTDYGSQSAYAVSIGDAFHDVEMQFPFVVRGELLAVAGFDKVHDYVVIFEGFGEGEGGLLILAFVQDADLVGGCGIGRGAVGAGGLRDAGEGLDCDGGITLLLHGF